MCDSRANVFPEDTDYCCPFCVLDSTKNVSKESMRAEGVNQPLKVVKFYKKVYFRPMKKMISNDREMQHVLECGYRNRPISPSTILRVSGPGYARNLARNLSLLMVIPVAFPTYAKKLMEEQKVSIDLDHVFIEWSDLVGIGSAKDNSMTTKEDLSPIAVANVRMFHCEMMQRLQNFCTPDTIVAHLQILGNAWFRSDGYLEEFLAYGILPKRTYDGPLSETCGLYGHFLARLYLLLDCLDKDFFRKMTSSREEELNMDVTILKEEGNKAFTNGDFQEAIKHYNDAILEHAFSHILYNNRAKAHFKLQNYICAMSDALRVTLIQPGWAKGYITQLEICKQLDHTDGAHQVLEHAAMFVDEEQSRREELKALQELQDYFVRKPGFPSKLCDETPFRSFYPTLSSPKTEISRRTRLSAKDKSGMKAKVREKQSVMKSRHGKTKLVKDACCTKPLPPAKSVSTLTTGTASSGTTGLSVQTGSKVTIKEKVDEEWNETQDWIKQGNAALLRKNWDTAVGLYQQALKAIEEKDKLKSKMTAADMERLYFVLALSLISTSSHTDIAAGRHMIQEKLSRPKKVDPLLSQYALGLALVNECRYKEAILLLDEARAQMDEYSDDVQYGHLPMEDAKKISNKDLKKAFSQLLEKSRFPPQPVAECRFERCQHARRAVYPADPEFKELVRVCCDVGCTVTYHVSCWKQARKEVASWDGDKEALVCPTPDCNGLILFIETVDLDGEVKTKHELKRHKMFLEEKEKKKVASKAKPKEKPPSKPKEKMGRRKTKSESETTQVVREPLDIKPAIREEPKVEVAVAPATQALPVRQPSAYVAKLDTRSPWTDECIVLNKKGAHIGGPKEMRPVSTESVDATSTVASFLRRNGGAVHKNSCLIELFIKELPAQLQAIIFCESSLDSLIELAFDRFAIVDDHFVLLEDAGKPPAEEETLGVEQVQELQHELQRLTVTAREAAQQDEWARKSDKLLRLVVQSQQQVKEKDDQLEHLRLSHQHAERTSEQTIAGLKQTLLQSEVRRLRSEMKGALKVYQREVEEGRTVLAHCSQLHEVFPSLEYDLADCANQWSLYVQQLLEKMSLMDTLYLAWIQAVESGEITSDNPVWVEEPPPRPHGSATVLSKWLHIALTMKPPVQQNPLPPVYPEPAPGSMDKLEYIISRVSIEHPFLSRAQIMSHVMKLKSVSTVPLAQLDRDQVVKLVKELIMQEGGTQEEDSFCAVCQNVFVSCHEMTVTLECSHKFHYKCVEQWLFIHKACPSCRAIIKL